MASSMKTEPMNLKEIREGYVDMWREGKTRIIQQQRHMFTQFDKLAYPGRSSTNI